MKITPEMVLKLHTLAGAAKIVQEGLDSQIRAIQRQQANASTALQEAFEMALPDNTLSLFSEMIETNYSHFDFEETWLYPFGFISRGYDNLAGQKDSLRISFEEFNDFVEKQSE